MTWLAEHAGRKLERRSNPAPRGMTVMAAQAVTQNPAYRSASHSVLARLVRLALITGSLRYRFLNTRLG